MNRRLGILLIAISACSFAATPVFARYASDSGVDTVTMLALRFAFASAAIWAIVIVRRMPIPSGRVVAMLAVLGAVGYAGQSFTFFTALTMVPASLVTLLLYLYPVIVAVASVFLFGERMTKAKVGAVVLALAGTALTVGRVAGGDPAGIALSVACGVIYAAYILIASRLTPSAGAIQSTAIILTSAGTVFALVGASRGYAMPSDASGWWAIAALAVVSTVVACITFFEGLKHVGATAAATLATIEPAVTVVLAAIFLGEEITWFRIAGGSLILVAVLVLARADTTTGELPVFEPDVAASVDPEEWGTEEG